MKAKRQHFIPDRSERWRDAAGRYGPKPQTLYELKSGPTDRAASRRTRATVQKVITEAAGPPLSRGAEPPLATLCRRIQKIMSAYPDPGFALDPRDDEFIPEGSIWPVSLPTEHVTMPYAVVPTTWHGHVTRARGKGKTRSDRVFPEAVLILSYVVFMYRQPGRFRGEMLWLNRNAVTSLFQISDNDYHRAVKHLQSEGFITKVIIRGLVPWDDRVKGAYTFVVPRVAKLRPVTSKAKSRGKG